MPPIKIRPCFVVIGCLVVMQINTTFAADQYLSHDNLSLAIERKSSEPTVAENIASMDKDHDGIVTVYEVRAFVEAKHGKAYKVDVLNDMESSAGGKSCSSPFSKPLY